MIACGLRQTYGALIKACDDDGSKKTLTHLLTREITHANMFMRALDAMGKLTDPKFGNMPRRSESVSAVHYEMLHNRSTIYG